MQKKCEKIWKAQVLHSIFAVDFAEGSRTLRARAGWSRDGRDRVRQQARKNQTAPLIGKGDLCLRSPQKLKIIWGPQYETKKGVI